MRYLQWLLFILILGPIELSLFFNLWFFRGLNKVRVNDLLCDGVTFFGLDSWEKFHPAAGAVFIIYRLI